MEIADLPYVEKVTKKNKNKPLTSEQRGRRVRVLTYWRFLRAQGIEISQPTVYKHCNLYNLVVSERVENTTFVVMEKETFNNQFADWQNNN